ncbi:FG-GAP repeat protein [Aliivibrio fischeri]|uniref:FG-GAP repeat protein n=1 Tax=Aliivibrio fischeri TaxID=668 RepID=UPI0007C4EFBB|nr:FG-GAP repeat protein [Aliivibrio fischeri]
MIKKSFVSLILIATVMLIGCGSEPESFNLLEPTVERVDDSAPHLVTFSWTESIGAASYTLCRKDINLINNCAFLGSSFEQELTVNLYGPLNNFSSSFFVIANGDNDVISNEVSLSFESIMKLVTYIKASNIGIGDEFGGAVSLSADGLTLAVGALNESSGDVNNKLDNTWNASGAVYIYRFENDRWVEQAYIKASNVGSGDNFGNSVSLSFDGNRLAIGARGEDSGDINSADNNIQTDSGAVYIFEFDGSTWVEQSYIKASHIGMGDGFGGIVSLSSDGNTLAVGAKYEDSGDANNSLDNTASASGAVYVYRFDGENWIEQSYIKASNIDVNDQFGSSLSLAADGNTLAVAAVYEDSRLPTNETDNTAKDSGAVYIYRYFHDLSWVEQSYIKAINIDSNDYFGSSVSLSSDGNTLAVGSRNEDSNAQHNPLDGNAVKSGAAYIYRFDGSHWNNQSYIKASNLDENDQFSGSISLSSDGMTLALGAKKEDSGNWENAQDNSALDSGAVYVYRFNGSAWLEKNYIKALNITEDDHFGEVISLSADGNILAVGAKSEDSKDARDSYDDNGLNSGAAYIF